MSDNFQQTVNLKDRINNGRDERSRVATNTEEKREFQKISRPTQQSFKLKISEKWIKIGLIVLAVILAIFIVRGLFFSNKKEAGEKWYRIIMSNGEIFYGQVLSDSKDKLIIKNVYYDYDQIKNGTSTASMTSSNLRLVKLGKEAYGPEGTREIMYQKIEYKEPLSDDSKVLKAIFNYEK